MSSELVRQGTIPVTACLRGGTVVDPEREEPVPADVLIEDGKLVAIGTDISPGDCPVVDVSGLVIMPGLLDLHVHLREPGEEWKEDIVSGTAAAAAGGFTAVCAMPNTSPAVDDEQVVRFVRDRAERAGFVTVYPVGAVTKQRAGKELAPIGEMVAAGAVAVSDDGSPVVSSELMRCALQYAGMFEIPVISHCEDPELARDGQINYGSVSAVLGLRGIPAEAEQVMVARDVMLARLTGRHVHIAHVSTAGSVELIRNARADGVRVTAEVTPHHLVLTDELVHERPYDTNTKMNPPLRTGRDIEALIAGLADGTIDAIATDHAPHHEDDKKVEYQVAAFGVSGLETAWPVIYTHLVRPGKLSLMQAARALTVNPARIVRVRDGAFTRGEAAAITIVDFDSERACDPDALLTRGKNTPFAGMTLAGWPRATLSGGRLVFCRELPALERAGWS